MESVSYTHLDVYKRQVTAKLNQELNQHKETDNKDSH